MCSLPCRAHHDFECAPRCSAHNQRKIYFQICNSGKSADFPELPFHGWGFGTNPLRHLALLDASSPEGGAFCALCRARHDFEWPPLRSGHVQRKDYFKFSRLSHSAERDRRFFHRRGRSRELHLQRLLPTEVRRCGGTPLPTFALSLQACKKFPLPVELANTVSLRGFPTQKSHCTKRTAALILCSLY